MSKIVITGSKGTTGSVLCKGLAADHFTVRTFSSMMAQLFISAHCASSSYNRRASGPRSTRLRYLGIQTR